MWAQSFQISKFENRKYDFLFLVLEMDILWKYMYITMYERICLRKFAHVNVRVYYKKNFSNQCTSVSSSPLCIYVLFQNWVLSEWIKLHTHLENQRRVGTVMTDPAVKSIKSFVLATNRRCKLNQLYANARQLCGKKDGF